MTTQKAITLAVSAVLLGAACITYGLLVPDLGQAPGADFVLSAPVQMAMVWATVGYWASSRGVIDTKTHWARPDTSVKRIIAVVFTRKVSLGSTGASQTA